MCSFLDTCFPFSTTISRNNETWYTSGACINVFSPNATLSSTSVFIKIGITHVKQRRSTSWQYRRWLQNLVYTRWGARIWFIKYIPEGSKKKNTHSSAAIQEQYPLESGSALHSVWLLAKLSENIQIHRTKINQIPVTMPTPLDSGRLAVGSTSGSTLASDRAWRG